MHVHVRMCVSLFFGVFVCVCMFVCLLAWVYVCQLVNRTMWLRVGCFVCLLICVFVNVCGYPIVG